MPNTKTISKWSRVKQSCVILYSSVNESLWGVGLHVNRASFFASFLKCCNYQQPVRTQSTGRNRVRWRIDNVLSWYLRRAQNLDGVTKYRITQKKRELLKNPTKIEEIKKNDRNWTITTCLLRDSNPNYQCLKITSCRWRPPPRTHSFTATTHFKSSRSFVSPCVCCMLCRMRLCRILQDIIFKQW